MSPVHIQISLLSQKYLFTVKLFESGSKEGPLVAFDYVSSPIEHLIFYTLKLLKKQGHSSVHWPTFWICLIAFLWFCFPLFTTN